MGLSREVVDETSSHPNIDAKASEITTITDPYRRQGFVLALPRLFLYAYVVQLVIHNFSHWNWVNTHDSFGTLQQGRIACTQEPTPSAD